MEDHLQRVLLKALIVRLVEDFARLDCVRSLFTEHRAVLCEAGCGFQGWDVTLDGQMDVGVCVRLSVHACGCVCSHQGLAIKRVREGLREPAYVWGKRQRKSFHRD